MRDKIWIFGGFALGGSKNDVNLFDLTTMSWLAPV
jgi:hypothetical protein